MSLFDNIVKYPLSPGEFFTEEFKKSQIYLHHTAGNSNPFTTITDWDTDSRGRIGTCVAIGRGQYDGKVVQAFSSKYWAHHLGVKNSVFSHYKVTPKILDKISIGIELCNWGQLTYRGGKFYNYVNVEIPTSEVCELVKPFKGFKYFQKYTDLQIQRVKELLEYWKQVYGIPIGYREDIWDVTVRALNGEPGVYTHNSVRADKVDIFPQPELIQMLKSL